MKSKVLVVAAALVLGGVSIACAQSQPNFGPNAPSRGDSYGKPPSGTLPPPSGAKAYRYRSHSYAMFRPHHRWWHRHHRHHHHY
jgi:hypothetical protein